jgi:hypothetical protein
MSAPDSDGPIAPSNVDEKTLRRIAQSLSIGIGLVETDGWTVILENAAFFEWFPPGLDSDGDLAERMTDLKLDRAKSRLEAGRPYSFTTDVDVRGRTLPISVEMRTLPARMPRHIQTETSRIHA